MDRSTKTLFYKGIIQTAVTHMIPVH